MSLNRIIGKSRVQLTSSSIRNVFLVILAFAVFGGCTPVPPGSITTGAARVSKSGGVCDNLRTELRAFEKRGIPYQAEALRSGKSRFSAKQKTTIKRYEGVLGNYLERNCHAKL